MPKVRVREGFREGRHVLEDAGRLARALPTATLELGVLLALAPAWLRAFFAVRAQGTLLGVWEGWIATVLSGGDAADRFVSLVTDTLQQAGRMGLGIQLLDVLRSLVLSPLLLCALALLYNGYIRAYPYAALDAVRMAGRNVRRLVVVALCCTVAEWIVQMIPSLASGVLSLLAGLLSWIPVLGTAASALAVVLSALVTLLADFGVAVVFSYVWICAACEGVPGFGALVRSWQLTRNATLATVSVLLTLLLLRWLVVIVLAALWLLALRPLGVSLAFVVYAAHVVQAIYLVILGGATSALYQRRPLPGSPRPGQFRTQNAPMKSANID